MVKVVGFPAPVDITGLTPGSAFQVGDHNPLYGIRLKAGDRVTAIIPGRLKVRRQLQGTFRPMGSPVTATLSVRRS